MPSLMELSKQENQERRQRQHHGDVVEKYLEQHGLTAEVAQILLSGEVSINALYATLAKYKGATFGRSAFVMYAQKVKENA